MEDNFRVRVDRAFGSLASTTPATTTSSSSSSPSLTSLRSLWSLTDDEIDRNQWNREEGKPEPEHGPELSIFSTTNSSQQISSGTDFRWEMEKDLDDLDDDEDEQSRDDARAKPDDYDDEEWEIKKSIGLDSTLDYEEEEDEYDKVAVGKVRAEDRVYMKDVNDYGIEIDSCNLLPDTFKDVVRDPRANHLAAKIRLKEDAEAARKMNALQMNEQPIIPGDSVNASEVGNLKPILKRREDELDSKAMNNQLDSKSQKRVRFDPACTNDENGESGEIIHMETNSSEDAALYQLPPDYPSGIPDYMRNPLKYTRYTFDSSNGVDEQSNRQAYMDFLNMVKGSKSKESLSEVAAPVGLPKSLTFIPKRKIEDATMIDNYSNSNHDQDAAAKESISRRNFLVGIAAGYTEYTESCAMEEDEPEGAAIRRSDSRKPGRLYRIKTKTETDESG